MGHGLHYSSGGTLFSKLWKKLTFSLNNSMLRSRSIIFNDSKVSGFKTNKTLLNLSPIIYHRHLRQRPPFHICFSSTLKKSATDTHFLIIKPFWFAWYFTDMESISSLWAFFFKWYKYLLLLILTFKMVCDL